MRAVDTENRAVRQHHAVGVVGAGPGYAGRGDRGPAGLAAHPGSTLPTVFALSAAEQLLVWSARRWRHGRHRWTEVEGEFRRHLGTDWADALLPWDMALDLLHRMPLGQPEIRNGCETGVSGDEMALLALIAVMQRDGGGSAGLLLARLARRQDREELAEWLGLVAAALPGLPVRASRPSGGGRILRGGPPDRSPDRSR